MADMETSDSSVNFTKLNYGGITAKHKSGVCYPYKDVYVHTLETAFPYVVNAALNILLSISASGGNVLIFVAIRRNTSIRLPSKLMICSLVLTDLGVGLVAQPLFAMFLVGKAKKSTDIVCFSTKAYGFSGSIFGGAALLTMTAISIDRYIALFFWRKYQEIITIRRVFVLLIFIWSFSVFYSSAWLWNTVLWGVVNVLIASVCLIIISVSYIKIYRELRILHGHRVQFEPRPQIQTQRQAGNSLNVAKYRTLGSSMLLIYISFLICISPYFCASLITTFSERGVLFQCVHEFLMTLVLMNSCLNPLLYCFRLPEIRDEVLQIFHKMTGHNFVQ